MLYVGLDAHQSLYVGAILDSEGTSVKRFRVRGSVGDLQSRLRRLVADQPFELCFEASCDYGHLYDALSPLAKRVVVAHPAKLRLIWADRRKNDRGDAEKLAKLLFAGLVPPVYVPTVDTRSWRRLIEQRKKLVQKRTRTKTALRALLRGCGVEGQPKGSRLWSVNGLAWLEQVALPTENDEFQRTMRVLELRHFDLQIQQVTQRLDKQGQSHPGVRLLRTIPGVGPRTAEAVVAYIDRPDRFRRIKQIGAYFGLVPSQDQSGAKNRLGHITREGPATVRGLLVEAAWWGVKRDGRLRAYYERRIKKNGEGKKIAIVATAHYLARVMLSMLKSGEPWRALA